MNKKTVERLLPLALKALEDTEHCKICKNKEKMEIQSEYRSQISAFGAAITMGGFKAAVAYFSKDATTGTRGEDVKRSYLIRILHYLYENWDAQPNSMNTGLWKDAEVIYRTVIRANGEELRTMQDRYLHAAVAVKLAMNAFHLVKRKSEGNNEQSASET